MCVVGQQITVQRLYLLWSYAAAAAFHYLDLRGTELELGPINLSLLRRAAFLLDQMRTSNPFQNIIEEKLVEMKTNRICCSGCFVLMFEWENE